MIIEDCLDNFKIRRALSADVPQLAALLNLLFSGDIEFAPDVRKQIDGLSLIVANPSFGSIFVLEMDGAISGMVSLLFSISTALGGKVAVLEDMIVDPSLRGKGFGSRLLEHGIDFARREGCKRITLLTDYDNAGAMNFYAKQGFVKSQMIPMRLVF